MSGRAPERVLEFLSSPGGAEDFADLALAVFAFQYAENPAYRRWCDCLGAGPDRVRTADGIPAVPASAFKEMEFVCGPAVAEFRTSGTTDGLPGRHLMPSLEPYRISALRHFERCVLPDRVRRRVLAVVPPPGLRPASSLSRMVGWIIEEYGDAGSGWYVSASGLEPARLAASLLGVQKDGAAVLLFATTASLLAFCEFCEAQRARFRLPPGSILIDTGGRKGTKAREIGPLAEFQADVYRRAGEVLGVPEERCVNEYGMTELASQFYDEPSNGGWGRQPRRKTGPAWVLSSVVDPVTLEPCAPGQPGLLRHVDLANVGSVSAVLTEDLGYMDGSGFVLLGRPRAAEARGCGLTFAEL